eukprot:m.580217 g.580217  ORF g.580217 m.580217 type:complete len:59 (-) comp22321_c0_seq4:394-570(-)
MVVADATFVLLNWIQRDCIALTGKLAINLQSVSGHCGAIAQLARVAHACCHVSSCDRW